MWLHFYFFLTCLDELTWIIHTFSLSKVAVDSFQRSALKFVLTFWHEGNIVIHLLVYKLFYFLIFPSVLSIRYFYM